MISYCTVTIDQTERYVPYLLESLVNKSALISEVLIAKPDSPPELDENWVEKGIKFRKFGTGVRYQQSLEHALNLHHCIEKSKNKYIMLGDVDTFWYSAIDALYLKLIHEYGLNYIGCSHNSAINHAMSFFPCVYATMFNKEEMPDENWLKGQHKFYGLFKISELHEDEDTHQSYDGKFLVPGAIKSCIDLYPNKTGLFDTGCKVWAWAKLNNWKWASFQTNDCHLYTTKYNRGNVKLDKLHLQKLLYHNVGGSNMRDTEFEEFKIEYENSK